MSDRSRNAIPAMLFYAVHQGIHGGGMVGRRHWFAHIIDGVQAFESHGGPGQSDPIDPALKNSLQRVADGDK